MRAVWCEDFGPIEAMTIQTVPRPAPGAGEVLIKVRAAGIGFVDLLIASGRYQVKPPLPFAPGSEYAGEIVGLGEGVTAVSVGQRVIGWGFTGAFAEYAVAPAAGLTVIPDSLSDADAAGFRVNYGTAYHGLVDRGRAQAGETLLVLGAGGALGSAAVQVGKALGLTVIAAASSADKRDYALSLGADAAVDYTAPNWREALKGLTDKLDLVFDSVGGAYAEPAFRSLAWGGRHLVVGFAAGTIPALPFNLALLKGADLVGVDYARFGIFHQPAKNLANTKVLLDWVESGKLQPLPGKTIPFADFASALGAVAGRSAVGRLVLDLRHEA
ncbi:NADPH:quinone oxidoreductase family protein [Oleomonas cavernae]|uniref:NADPH:quinone oxidoreductase family protein n=2 Tax=Oleomonas cavernae TaxID=2320859 RepID=A0A418WB78_9PROT|nr:NADPH:quinone oxidoreductase family protein [Oleomonas cavernae]